MVLSEGVEPPLVSSELTFLPLEDKRIMAAPRGFEPQLTVLETVVLNQLDDRATIEDSRRSRAPSLRFVVSVVVKGFSETLYLVMGSLGYVGRLLWTGSLPKAYPLAHSTPSSSVA